MDLALRDVFGVLGVPGAFGGMAVFASNAARFSAVSGRDEEEDCEVGRVELGEGEPELCDR